ncbi:phosphoenolpyruvate synthase [Patescibacteria group bacterium]|nr:phosphoenolpyruvate synthase [Patescibacteria group bacterium]
MDKDQKYILWFSEISKNDVALVGGKNASLGEMFSELTRERINVPDGFALTTKAYWYLLKENGFDKKLEEIFSKFDPENLRSLQKTGKKARQLFNKIGFPKDLEKEILETYKVFCQKYGQNCDVAIRSSGVCEDQPDTSFAGQFETFLNISGEKQLLEGIKKCLASAFGDRVIAYRQEKQIPDLKFALSVGVQKMVRSDLASSGIMFTIDTETGFPNIVLINSIFGVGEMIVKGLVTPDEFLVFKPTLKQGFKSIIVRNMGRKTKKYVYDTSRGGLKEVGVSKKEQEKFSLSNEEVLILAKWACLIEDHYNVPQDIEWAKDGKTNELYIVQSRPETVHGSRTKNILKEYELKTEQKPILVGIAVGNKIGTGKARIIKDISRINDFIPGEVLITKMTDPDWVPILRQAAAIITDEGGRTSHAAIVAREFGIPAIVGTRTATSALKTGQDLTVDCSSGQGLVFEGKIDFEIKTYDLEKIPELKTKVMVNIGTPQSAFKNSFLPASGVGLARTEFILAEKIKIHPLALYHFNDLKNLKASEEEISKIQELTIGYENKKEYFIDELAEGIAQIASAFWPRPVIVRLSDLKTNEYKALIGGRLFEPDEANPMIGFRGASRYYDEKFLPAFKMECRALKKAREEFGLNNIWIMVPFCRTPDEGKKIIQLMESNGLEKGKDGLKVIVMAEIPSNVILADQFLEIFDGFSIGSNDLTQLVLGIDRDSSFLAKIGDERNQAVKEMISMVIKKCQAKQKYVGICGDAPSSFSEFTEFLIKEGIESISVSPDVLIKTIIDIANIEKER